MLSRLVLLLCFVVFAGCAAPTINQEMLMPAKAGEVTTLKRMAVGNFDNDSNGAIRSGVENALASVVLRDKPYFTMVDSRIIRDYMAKAGQGRPLEGAQAHKLGVNAGADGIVMGTVTANGWNDSSYSETRSRCNGYDRKGNCVSESNYSVSCIKRTAGFSFTPKVVNVGTGAIVASQAFTSTTSDSGCSDGSPITSGPQMLGDLRATAIKDFRNFVAPHYVTVAIALVADDDSKMPPPVKEQVANGVEFAKHKRVDKACELWRAATSSHQAGYALPYLTGLCAEIEGDLDEAQKLYNLADKRCTKPVAEIGLALTRLKQSKGNISKLDKQLK